MQEISEAEPTHHGHTRQRAALREALEGPARLVTIHGEPGIGKSHLARQHTGGPQGGLLADFAHTDQEEVEAAVATRLAEALSAIEVAAPRGDLGAVARAVGGRLVVLDNVDRLVDRLGPVVDVLLREPELRLIVTSRQPLGHAEETRIALEPLTIAEGAALFKAQAARLIPQLELGEAQRQQVRQIVSRLDGNPLAIELAAGRMQVLSLEQILERLRRRFDLLKRQPDSGARFATLQAAFDESWELLSTDQRAFLAQCSHFRAHFSAEAAEAIVALEQDEDPLNLLHALVDRSMIRSRRFKIRGFHAPRFILPASLRAYAARKHTSMGHPEDLAARHMRYYLDACRGWRAALEGQTSERIAAEMSLEIDDVVAAYHWACQHDEDAAEEFSGLFGQLLDTSRSTTGMLTLLEVCLELTPRVEEDGRRKAERLRERAETLINQGKTAAALRDLSEAVRLVDPSEDPRLSLKLHQALAAVHIRRVQLDAARHHYERALTLALEQDQRIERFKILGRLGRLCINLGALEDARRHLADALEEMSRDARLAELTSEAKLLSYMVTAQLESGLMDQARSSCRKALLANRLKPSRRMEATIRELLGRIAHELGDFDEAEQQYEMALQLHRERGSRSSLYPLLMRLGGLHLELGARARARQRFEELLEADRASELAGVTEQARMGLGLVELLTQDTAGAQATLEEALSELHQSRRDLEEGLTLAFLALSRARQDASADTEEELTLARMKLEHASSWAELTLALIEAALDELRLSDEALTADLEEDARQRGREAARQVFLDAKARLEQVGEGAGHPDPQHVVGSRARVALLIMSGLLSAPGEDDDDGIDTSNLPANSLVIGPQEAWFQVPGTEPVDIHRKRILRRLLGALVSRHEAQAGEAVSADDLIRAGWPDQRNILSDSAHNRLYVALNRLRNEGLGDLIQTERGGYRLDPDVPLLVLEE